MIEANDTRVTVIGLGAMGRALARAYLAAGYTTTVWNRTAATAAPLAAEGATHYESIVDAVAASPLVIACVTTYEATMAALEPAWGAMTGRTLVTLNSGAPVGARDMAARAAEHGARFLDGAVKNVPEAVGRPDTLLYYSGDRAVFDDYEHTLRVLGGDTQHLGDEVDLAALFELAVGGTLLPALLGFFQGAALVTARGIEASTIVPHTVKWLAMIGTVLPKLAQEIDSGDYSEASSSVGMFLEGAAHDEEIGREAGLDVGWHAPMHQLLQRGVDEGHAEHSISALVEVLRNPAK